MFCRLPVLLNKAQVVRLAYLLGWRFRRNYLVAPVGPLYAIYRRWYK